MMTFVSMTTGLSARISHLLAQRRHIVHAVVQAADQVITAAPLLIWEHCTIVRPEFRHGPLKAFHPGL
jgi:hypothetical protein